MEKLNNNDLNNNNLDPNSSSNVENNEEEGKESVLLEETYKAKSSMKQEEQVITEEEFLCECSRYNDIEGVKDVLSCGVVKLNYQNEHTKNSALHMACANANIEIIELLLNAGIDVNLQNDSGNTALRK